MVRSQGDRTSHRTPARGICRRGRWIGCRTISPGRRGRGVARGLFGDSGTVSKGPSAAREIKRCRPGHCSGGRLWLCCLEGIEGAICVWFAEVVPVFELSHRNLSDELFSSKPCQMKCPRGSENVVRVLLALNTCVMTGLTHWATSVSNFLWLRQVFKGVGASSKSLENHPLFGCTSIWPGFIVLAHHQPMCTFA
jgi:hypothetical protein